MGFPFSIKSSFGMDFICLRRRYNARRYFMSTLQTTAPRLQAQGLRDCLGGFVPHQDKRETP